MCNVFCRTARLKGSSRPSCSASGPDGFAWDYTHFSFGWGNSVHETTGATEADWGSSVAGSPEIEVMSDDRLIRFTYDREKLGIPSWEGVRVYVTTWDFDGVGADYHALSPNGGPWTMGGGDPNDPKVMNDLGPVTLPAPP